MQQCIINSQKLKVWKRTGSEGCRHDPYHFIEYVVERVGGLTVTVHEGLATWVRFNGKPFNLYPIGDEDGVARSRVDAYVKLVCGYTIQQLERFHRKAESRCRNCGIRNRFHEVPGYPGETLIVCECDFIVGGRFNESAII